MKWAPDSVKHAAMYTEILISENPSDMAEAISFTQTIQERFLCEPTFLFWRGRVLIYSGAHVDVGKSYVKKALEIDPDNVQYQKFWKNQSKMDRIKEGADMAQKDNNL